MRRLALAFLALTALMLVPAGATGATKNGITPVAPKAGTTLPVGQTTTFKMRVRGKGTVWVHVCKSTRKSKDGVICNKALIVQAKKKGTLFQVKPQFFDYPEFWLNTPGTYYWQAYRIDCTGNTSDCKREGPVTKIRVA